MHKSSQCSIWICHVISVLHYSLLDISGLRNEIFFICYHRSAAFMGLQWFPTPGGAGRVEWVSQLCLSLLFLKFFLKVLVWAVSLLLWLCPHAHLEGVWRVEYNHTIWGNCTALVKLCHISIFRSSTTEENQGFNIKKKKMQQLKEMHWSG